MTAASREPRYPWKEIPGSSHLVLLGRVESRGDGLALLDLGFGTGELARRVGDPKACRAVAVQVYLAPRAWARNRCSHARKDRPA